MVPNDHCVPYHHTLTLKNKVSFTEEWHNSVVKSINFIKSQPLNIGLLNILCEEIGNTQQALPPHAKAAWVAQG